MLRFGTVGSGWITDEYIGGAKESGLWELSAVYSRTRERGEEFAEKHGASSVFTSLEEMARSSLIDAVYLASPNAFHFEQAKTFLEHGKHVICEKPLCAREREVKELYELADKKGLIFLEAILFLHLPQRRLLEDTLKKAGKLSLVKIDFCRRSSKWESFEKGELPNIFNPSLETGALMDLGIYCIYPALALLGEPESFHAEASFLSSGADGCGAVLLKYPETTAVITYSKIGDATENSEFQGSEGTVTVASISHLSGITFQGRDGKTESIFADAEEKHKMMGYEARDFFRFITEPQKYREEYESCRKLALQAARLLEGIRKKAGIRFERD